MIYHTRKVYKSHVAMVCLLSETQAFPQNKKKKQQ